MSTHSVRDLKNNPSTLYRELDAGQTAVLTRRGQPVGVAVPFSLVLDHGAATALATSLALQGSITLATAARIAGRGLEEYLILLRDAGVADLLYDVERLDEDLEALRDL